MELGQLVCGGFQGTSVTEQARALVTQYKVSTFILLRKNTQLVPQMARLIAELQHIAYTSGYTYPLLFAVDEEGGMLNALFDPENLTQFPGAMALAATGDEELVYLVSKAVATELRQIGFLVILGPVLDVITKLLHQLVSVRAFGTTVDEVTRYGKACARGFRDGGLFTVGKHFPGIGNASVDLLLEVPMMTDLLDQIRRFNSVPFAELIKAGLLDGISAAGCGVPTISPDETHACLLPVLLTRLLREELGFDGFVISECLEMDALYHSVGLGQGVMLALYAGCDLVMVCHDFKLQVEAIELIAAALESNMLDEEIVTALLQRLRRVQERLPKWLEMFPKGTLEVPPLFRETQPAQWQRHLRISETAYSRSITLVRDYEGALPLTQHVGHKPQTSLLLLTPLLNPVYPVQHEEKLYTGEGVFRPFGELLSNHKTAHPFNVLHTTYTANGLTALHEQLIERSNAVVVVTSEALRNMYQIGIVKYVSLLCGAHPRLLAQKRLLLAKPVVLVATSSPYDFFYNKSIGSAYLCCYDYTENVLRELAKVLMGAATALGCVPGERPEKPKKEGKERRPPKRRWLVDDFDFARDWRGLAALFRGAGHSDAFCRLLLQLLHGPGQRHFVIRNSLLNTISGVALTWVAGGAGSLVHVLVDRSKRLQLIGRNLHARAMRHLEGRRVQLGLLFPLVAFPNATLEPSVAAFFTSAGWTIAPGGTAHVMVRSLEAWSVPPKILKELMIVGVRFDISLQPDRLMELVLRADERGRTQAVYQEAVRGMLSNDAKVIIALEPTHQNVIGSVVLFTNKSKLLRFFPFLEDAGGGSVVGALACPVIDLLYLNLTEIFRFGLVCTAVTYLKTNYSEMALCVFVDAAEDLALGLRDMGFETWRTYSHHYGVQGE